MDLISVIVPVYNAEEYLIRCVDSIRHQTYENLEIILVDDGSPDNCPLMCDELKEQDSRIKVIHKQNAGQGLARNDGLDIAQGAYVTFVDSDDWISPEHIENLYNAIKKHSADACLGNHIKVNSNGDMTVRMLRLKEGIYEGDIITQELLLPLLGADLYDDRDVLINSSVSMNLYSMDCIDKNKIRFISERYAVAEDFYFNVDFFNSSSKIVYIKENGYFYFQNLQSTGEKYNPKRFERTLNYYNVICRRVESYGLADKVAHRVERSFLMKIRVAIRHIVLSDLPRKEKYRQIKEILGNDTVKSALFSYPIETYPPSMRLLMKSMRKENINAVYFLMRFREKGRRNRGTKALLKWIGIGR
ncbi:MAG: glycosyltransferase family 2 protein [Ruminococcaceae bacterium]|nr:glycosyltransferase family 2 protein [Oscillospiraceae bacterium]